MAHKKKREENGARGSRRDVSDEWRGGMCRTILTRTNWFLGATRKSFGGGGGGDHGEVRKKTEEFSTLNTCAVVGNVTWTRAKKKRGG